MASSLTPASISEPFPIFTLAHRYLLYDIDVVTYIRQKYNISGVLAGSLPQASQQNVFLGLPLELMPEEARLMVEKGNAYVVDDVVAHRRHFIGRGLSAEERSAYHATLRKQGQAAAKENSRRSDERKEAALKKLRTQNWNDVPDDMLRPSSKRDRKFAQRSDEPESDRPDTEGEGEGLLFGPSTDATLSKSNAPVPSSTSTYGDPEPYAITPTTSYPPLQESQGIGDDRGSPEVPPSYSLYKHLHESGYFLAPGLRFGCQYMAYPGDPLRFHSHFLCNGMDWEQEFDLLDLVGGGRLGTGVKKGFLIGAKERNSPVVMLEGRDDVDEANVRTFCVEWGGM